MSGGAWPRDAPCRDDPRFVFDDTADVTTVEILQLLSICQRCPFRAACVATVLPAKSGFDGVCGGRVWVNGVVRAECDGAKPDELDESGSYIPHGTEAGARAHSRRGERACLACRQVARAAAARRRARNKSG
jgi:hypothetical protein